MVANTQITFESLRGRLRRSTDVGALQRWHQKIEVRGQCWIWTGATTKGYPAFGYPESRIPSYGHRASYLMFVGDLQPGLVVRHVCDTPLCVNPEHLVCGTVSDNIQDMYSRHRAIVGERSRHAKLAPEDVFEIRRLRKDGILLRELAARFGMSLAGISVICSRKKWRHLA